MNMLKVKNYLLFPNEKITHKLVKRSIKIYSLNKDQSYKEFKESMWLSELYEDWLINITLRVIQKNNLSIYSLESVKLTDWEVWKVLKTRIWKNVWHKQWSHNFDFREDVSFEQNLIETVTKEKMSSKWKYVVYKRVIFLHESEELKAELWMHLHTSLNNEAPQLQVQYNVIIQDNWSFSKQKLHNFKINI